MGDQPKKEKYRAGVVGLGWMGLLYDLGKRDYDSIAGSFRQPIYDLDSPDRILPPSLDPDRRFHHYDHPGRESLVSSYAEALADRPEVMVVTGADRDSRRLELFRQRYDLEAVYTDALEMYERENLDIVAIATNTKGRCELTIAAVQAGVAGIFVDKPMAFTLAEADAMVGACADAGVPLVGGATSVSHPSFRHARGLVKSGIIGEFCSLEARVPLLSQHQDWCYFLNAEPAWVCGIGDAPRRDRGSTEFLGQGLIVCQDGTVVHIREGAPDVRISGSSGEICFTHDTWHLWKDVEKPAPGRVEMPWPAPQFLAGQRTVYCLNDLINCMEGRLDEPCNSGRRVARALETEIAMKLSASLGGERVELPLPDRSQGLTYDWFR